MSIKVKKRTTLLRYWTTRYIITLMTGVLILSLFSLWWMEKTALEYRLSLLKYLADETADRAIKDNGQIVVGPMLAEIIEEREKILHLDQQPIIYIVDVDGNIIYTMPQLYIKPEDRQLPSIIMDSKDIMQRVEIKEDSQLYVIKSPINFDYETKGWVVIAQEEGALKEVNQDHGWLAMMMGAVLVLGCSVIYVLSRKISRPIQNVANAAVQVRKGNYDTNLKEEEAREEEIYELVESFKAMTSRLKQSDKMRAEMLAGVTHDLKTPVTSISGLIQAVKDDVVTGEERKEFLDISLKETQRLQRMIEDLLDYNAMSSGSFKMQVEKENMNQFIQEISHRWKVTQEEQHIELVVHLPDEVLFGRIDSLRMQQIMINLLNNAKQAIEGKGSISLLVYEADEALIGIDIQDDGRGIPKHEQDFIFEPFYRGENKKLKIRGLGLGLPFSRMLAKAQNGDLVLKESSEQGTTFTLYIEKDSQA
ncbi:sensor histidine kinase [Peribacillus sp. Hz7]|uniref:HAMP domain-containing sensor histidine kinase n=1 Tax=Peribacillus sp. Hz7 TaxID=3344873 RepID=UPI0035CA7D0B